MPREKSYSARISRAAALSLAFFVILPRLLARRAHEDADIIAPFRMHDNQQSSLVRLSQNDPTVLHLRMGRVGNRQRQRVAEHRARFLETDALLRPIRFGLAFIHSKLRGMTVS